jgi:hypothetical protein
MTIYVRRGGILVDKKTGRPMMIRQRRKLATPMLSRLEPFESPISGRLITSWRERDREMTAHDCYDPRDVKGATDGR